MNFRIDPEFKDYLGALDGESKQALEESLMAEGCRDALVVWPQANGDPILLDGHNRHAICEDLSIPYRVVECPVPIADREGAVAWIVRNQRARRNLTPEQISYLRANIYQSKKMDPNNNLKLRWQEDSPNCKNCTSDTQAKNTADQVAEEFGVSPRTIHNDRRFAERVDAIANKHGPEAKTEILAGRKKVADYEPPGEAARESLRVEPDIRSGNHAPIPDFQTVPEIIPGDTPPAPPSKPARGSVEVGVFMMDGLSIVLQKLNELVEAGTPDRKTLPAILESIGEAEAKLRELSRALTEGV